MIAVDLATTNANDPATWIGLTSGLVTLPSGATAFASFAGANDVKRIDATGVTTTITSYGSSLSPSALAIAPDGSQLYVGLDGSTDRLSIVSLPGGAIDATVTLAGRPSLIAADSSAAYVVVDTPDGVRVQRVAAGGTHARASSGVLPDSTPADIAVDPRGRFLYVLHESGAVSRVGLPGLAVTRAATLPDGSWSSLIISPDGAWAYAVNANIPGTSSSGVARVNTTTGAVSPMVRYDGFAEDIAQVSTGLSYVLPLMDVQSSLRIADVPVPVVTDVSPTVVSTKGEVQFVISLAKVQSFVDIKIGRFPCAILDTDYKRRTVTCVAPNSLKKGGMADLTITHGEEVTVLDDKIAFLDPPQLDRITPTRGGREGGTELRLIGSHFDESSARVTVGGKTCPVVRVSDDASSLTCRLPSEPSRSTVDVTVTTGGGKVTLADAFTYIGEPRIASVSPTQVSSYGGAEITINGANFTDLRSVTIGGQPCDVKEARTTKTQIVCQMPANSPIRVGLTRVSVETTFGMDSREDLLRVIAEQIPAPSRVDAFTSRERVLVFWNSSSLETARLTGYQIDMQTGSASGAASTWTTIRTSTGTRTAASFTRTALGLAEGTLVRFRVATVNIETRKSTWATPSPWRELTDSLPLPKNFAAVYNSATDLVTLSWDDPDDGIAGGHNVRGYAFQYLWPGASTWTDLGSPIVTDSGTAQFSLENVPKGTFKMRIRSIGWPGELYSGWSVDRAIRK